MMLKNKVAVIYGAGGAIGGAVARAFALEGSRLFLTGRARATVEAVAADIVAAGAGGNRAVRPGAPCRAPRVRLDLAGAHRVNAA